MNASICPLARTGKVKGRMFRIGHLGDSNDLTLLATLAGCEMGLKLAGLSLSGSGTQAAMDYFATNSGSLSRRAQTGVEASFS